MLLLDSIETCLSLEPLRSELPKVGLRSEDLELWFAHTLRDAFARESAGAFAPLKDVLETSLTTLARSRGHSPDHSDVKKIIESFAELPAHSDVLPALASAKAHGIRVAVLTNGGSKPTRKAFEKSRIADLVHEFLSVDDVKHFKPSREAYLLAARKLGVEPKQCTLVAAHGWDILGALEAGLGAAFVERKEPLSDELAKKVAARGKTLEDVVTALARQERRRSA